MQNIIPKKTFRINKYKRLLNKYFKIFIDLFLLASFLIIGFTSLYLTYLPY